MATSKDKVAGKTQPAVLKLSLGERTHRVPVDLATLTFDALVAHIRATLEDALPMQWAIEYTDEEGDHVTLAHARELPEALGVLLAAQRSVEGSDTIAFRVVPRSVPFSRRIAPWLRKVGELSASVVRIASERSIQLRNSDVVSRGRASLTTSATRTGSLIRSASRGVANGLHTAHSAVSTRIERRRSRSSSSSSSPSSSPSSPLPPSFSESGNKPGGVVFSPLASADVETVDLRASTSGSEVDVEAGASASHSQEMELLVDVPTASVETSQADEQAEETAYESDADTLATTSCDEEDREWDLVSAPAASGVGSAMPLIAEDSWTR